VMEFSPGYLHFIPHSSDFIIGINRSITYSKHLRGNVGIINRRWSECVLPSFVA
jgi:hypothetical protein